MIPTVLFILCCFVFSKKCLIRLSFTYSNDLNYTDISSLLPNEDRPLLRHIIHNNYIYQIIHSLSRRILINPRNILNAFSLVVFYGALVLVSTRLVMTNVMRNRQYSDYNFFLIFHLEVVYNNFLRTGNKVSQQNRMTRVRAWENYYAQVLRTIRISS